MREHGLERMLRDARINRIVEGASEVMTAFIALMGMKGVGESLESVLRQAKHPVGNFGRLAHFARTEFDDLVIGHALEGLHPQLGAEGRELAKLTKRLARDVVRLLQRHRERILDMELIHERVAGAVVDLYAMAAVISRLQSMLEHASGNGHQKDGHFARGLTVGRSFCRHAAQRVRARLDSLSTSREDDQRIVLTADAVLGWSGTNGR
jgi:alkylation response protein AidB-like acyl-CoA dehydrogenase